MHIREELRLIEFIRKNIGQPFLWGECDCNTLALDMIDDVLGTDLASQIRGKYSDEAGAIEFRRQSRWGNFIALLEEAGFIEGRKGFEQTGDLLIVQKPDREEVQIYLGLKIVSVLPEQGVHFATMAPLRSVHYRVWRHT